MHPALRSIFAPVVAVVVLTSAVSAAEPGEVDFGELTAPKKGQFVQVTLGKGVLKFASFFIRHHERDVSDVISGLSQIRVNVVGLDESNRDVTSERVQRIRQDLTRQGWDQIVAAQGKGEEDVAIYLKLRQDDVIEGVVVTVIDARKKEAVLVNIVGTIKAEQLAALGEQLKVEPLRRVKTARADLRIL